MISAPLVLFIILFISLLILSSPDATQAIAKYSAIISGTLYGIYVIHGAGILLVPFIKKYIKKYIDKLTQE